MQCPGALIISGMKKLPKPLKRAGIMMKNIIRTVVASERACSSVAVRVGSSTSMVLDAGMQELEAGTYMVKVMRRGRVSLMS